VQGFNLHEALAQCGHLLESHGGHAAAAGLRIIPENIPAFREAFTKVAVTEMGTDDRCVELLVDAEASLQMLTQQIVEQIDNLAPFGHGNNRPLFCASDV